MEDQLISIETGILAKEKGFDEPCMLVVYNPAKISSTGNIIKGVYTRRTYSYYNNKPKDGIERIHLITQSLLAKWLREKHKIDIIVTFSEFGRTYGYKIYYIEDGATEFINHRYSKFETFEEAVEEALKEALKLIKI